MIDIFLNSKDIINFKIEHNLYSILVLNDFGYIVYTDDSIYGSFNDAMQLKTFFKTYLAGLILDIESIKTINLKDYVFI